MGSLVMSQVAPGIGQHPYHHIMVDDTHNNEASETVPQTSQHTSSHTHTVDDTSNASDLSAQHYRDSHPSSATLTQQATTQDNITEESRTAQRAPNYYSQNRGFDQSGFPLSSEPRGLASSSPSSPRLQPTWRSTRSLGGSEATSPSRIKVRDLSHIQSFASEEYLSRSRLGNRSGTAFSDSGRQYEISSMPVTDIIEMVAGLLTKITTTNDRQHEHIHRPIPPPEEQSNMNPQASCVLAFHGKNVPSITILSYLSRIHKYCPTTYEVFLSLLVYFDRMTEMVNKGFLENMQRDGTEGLLATPGSPTPTPRSPVPMNLDSPRERNDVDTPPTSGSIAPSDRRSQASMPPSPPVTGMPGDLSQFFVVDSYNIHRLVIAGVTCASKFFSDVFYTNSRYAKV